MKSRYILVIIIMLFTNQSYAFEWPWEMLEARKKEAINKEKEKKEFYKKERLEYDYDYKMFMSCSSYIESISDYPKTLDIIPPFYSIAPHYRGFAFSIKYGYTISGIVVNGYSGRNEVTCYLDKNRKVLNVRVDR